MKAPPTRWLTTSCEAVFVPHRNGVHIAREGSDHTLCARTAERRARRRGDTGKLCRTCIQAAWVAHHFDTRPMPLRWDVRHQRKDPAAP